MARVATLATLSPEPANSRSIPDEAKSDLREFKGSAGYDFLMQRLEDLLRGVTENALGYPANDGPEFRFYKIGVHNGVRDVVRIIKNIMEDSA